MVTEVVEILNTEPTIDLKVPTKPIGARILELYSTQYQRRIKNLNDVTSSFSCIDLLPFIRYQFYGIKELFSNSQYVWPISWYMLGYVSTYIINMFLFWVLIAPFIGAFYGMIFGPGALPLTILYSINVVHFNTLQGGIFLDTDQVFLEEMISVTLKKRNRGYLKDAKPPVSTSLVLFRKLKDNIKKLATLEFWVFTLPYHIIVDPLIFTRNVAVAAIALIPIVGILALYAFDAPNHGFVYGLPYAKYKLKLSESELTCLYYERYAHWLAMGLYTGFTEIIPLVGAFVKAINFIGYAVLEYDTIIAETPRSNDEGPKAPYPSRVVFLPLKASNRTMAITNTQP